MDNSATTRAYPEVGDLVYKVMCQDYGNPSSMHRKGVDAEHYVKEAKETIAKVLKVNAKDIYYDEQCRTWNFKGRTCDEFPPILSSIQAGILL